MLRVAAKRSLSARGSVLALRALSSPAQVTPPSAPAAPADKAELVSFTFIEDGEEVEVSAAEGRTLLEAAHDNEIDLEGACDHSLACSTCHVIFEQEVFDRLGEVDDEEMDMLDLAFGLEDTSRLGCQIKVTKELAGMKVRIPGESNNLQ